MVINSVRNELKAIDGERTRKPKPAAAQSPNSRLHHRSRAPRPQAHRRSQDAQIVVLDRNSVPHRGPHAQPEPTAREAERLVLRAGFVEERAARFQRFGGHYA